MTVIKSSKTDTELSLKKWHTVGKKGFSKGKVDYLSFSIYNNIPSVAYRDWSCGGRATVMKYDY